MHYSVKVLLTLFLSIAGGLTVRNGAETVARIAVGIPNGTLQWGIGPVLGSATFHGGPVNFRLVPLPLLIRDAPSIFPVTPMNEAELSQPVTRPAAWALVLASGPLFLGLFAGFLLFYRLHILGNLILVMPVEVVSIPKSHQQAVTLAVGDLIIGFVENQKRFEWGFTIKYVWEMMQVLGNPFEKQLLYIQRRKKMYECLIPNSFFLRLLGLRQEWRKLPAGKALLEAANELRIVAGQMALYMVVFAVAIPMLFVIKGQLRKETRHIPGSFLEAVLLFGVALALMVSIMSLLPVPFSDGFRLAAMLGSWLTDTPVTPAMWRTWSFYGVRAAVNLQVLSCMMLVVVLIMKMSARKAQ